MDALVMCGGRGTRLDAGTEKPLVTVAGEPMVDRVLGALSDSRAGPVFAVVSPHAPRTRAHLRSRVQLVETPGEGYVADLGVALDDERVSSPVLTVAADLPLLDGGVVDRVLDAYDDTVTGRGCENRDGYAGSLTVAVPAERKHELGASVDTSFREGGRELAPAGVNVVGGGNADGERGETLVVDDARLAVNVNRPGDLAVAERLART